MSEYTENNKKLKLKTKKSNAEKVKKPPITVSF